MKKLFLLLALAALAVTGCSTDHSRGMNNGMSNDNMNNNGVAPNNSGMNGGMSR